MNAPAFDVQRNRPPHRRAAVIVACASCLIASVDAVAHAISRKAPTGPHWTWTFEPWVLVCLGIGAALYAIGVAAMGRRARAGRGLVVAAGSFAGGWLVTLIALASPLDAMSDASFFAHMVQHELLMIVAAPLFVLARPLAIWVWALPAAWRGRVGAFFHRPGWRVPWLLLTGPLWAWILHALALWLWHVPRLFEAALHNEAIHAIQHASFLGTALLFWWSVLVGTTRHERGVALLSLFTTMVHTGALGALLTLSTVVWYPSYVASAGLFGLTALQDQQLGGLVMWVPSALVYIVAMLALASRWLAEPSGGAVLRPRLLD